MSGRLDQIQKLMNNNSTDVRDTDPAKATGRAPDSEHEKDCGPGSGQNVQLAIAAGNRLRRVRSKLIFLCDEVVSFQFVMCRRANLSGFGNEVFFSPKKKNCGERQENVFSAIP